MGTGECVYCVPNIFDGGVDEVLLETGVENCGHLIYLGIYPHR